MSQQPLDYRDLEAEVWDISDAARLASHFAHDLFDFAPEDQAHKLTRDEGDMLCFILRVMVEKTDQLKSRWNEVHESTVRPTRLVGGDRNG